MDNFPLLPVEEEGRLLDATVRESFVERIFTFMRWSDALAAKMTPEALARFHAEHELTLRVRSPVVFGRMKRLVSKAKPRNVERAANAYGKALMETMQLPVTRRRHAQTLRRLSDRIKSSLPGDERRALDSLISGFREGTVPLSAPRALLSDHARTIGDSWLLSQKYLNPFPQELLDGPNA